jgi:hypothetical protein
MKRRHRDPHDPEVHQAVLERIRRMSREERQRTVEELPRAPEGVEDPWPPYEDVACSGSELPRPEGTGVPANANPPVPAMPKASCRALFSL